MAPRRRTRPAQLAEPARAGNSGLGWSSKPHLPPPARFALHAGLYWGIAQLVVTFVPAVQRIAVSATLASLPPALGLCLSHVVRIGSTVSSLGTTIDIVPDCTSLAPTMLLGGAIAAFPASFSSKLIGLCAGFALLWVYNIVRIGILIVVLARFPAAFDAIHIYLWQTVTIVIVVALFALWVLCDAAGRRT